MRLITRTLSFAGRLAGGAARLIHYIAASTLMLGELQEGVRSAWQEFNPRDEDIEEGLFLWEKDCVQRFIPASAHVLVAGCGSGREIVALIARNCRLTGIDPAGSALSLARSYLGRHSLSATLIEGFVEDIPIDGQFDAVLFSWTSYSLIPCASRRTAALRKIADHLKPGGRVILMYDTLPRPHRFMISIARVVGSLARSDWRIEQGDYLTRKRFHGQEFYSFLHAFIPEEIERESAAAGFRIVHRSDPSREMVFVLEANR